MTEDSEDPINIDRAEYYLKAFERYEKEDKHTWNWPAFFFGGTWLLYRKMYLYAFIFGIADYLGFKLLETIVDANNFFPLNWKDNGAYLLSIFFVQLLIRGLILGYFGNVLYYRVVCRRIMQGYHLQKEYLNTSITLALFCPFGCFIGSAIFGALDCFALKIDESEMNDLKNFEPSQKNFKKYLAKDRKNHIWGKCAVWIAILSMLLVISVAVKHQIDTDLQKEEVSIEKNK